MLHTGHSLGRMRVYLLTFCCYGSFLPGESGFVDRRTNAFGSRHLARAVDLHRYAPNLLATPPYTLSEEARGVVLRVIQNVCEARQCKLLAAHVRTNHVHIVVEADVKPEKVMLDIKANVSRLLNQQEGQRNRWSRHESTRYLWTKESIDQAVSYVVSGQGRPMQVYELQREPSQTPTEPRA